MSERETPKPAIDGAVPPPEIFHLHPEADARLVIHGDSASDVPKEFLVSSAVLSVASPYFRALFGPNFKEGIETRRGDCPTIVMGDDDLDGMETILSLLHFRTLKRYDTLTPEALAAIALLSDKYDCAKALRPWVSHWFRAVRGTTDPEKLGFLLVAAYFLRIPSQFLALSARAVRHASISLASIWAKHDIISLLPHEIRDALMGQVSQTLDKMHEELQLVEASLQLENRGSRTGCRLCQNCGRRLPPAAKKCSSCLNSSGLQVSYCTCQTRVAEYFAVLRRCNLWPSVRPFKECTISELANRFARAEDDRLHRCNAGRDCALRKALERLSERVDKIVSDVAGVSLDSGGREELEEVQPSGGPGGPNAQGSDEPQG
ncbi:hypothetical protein C8A05DRAFT_12187 [Staphylotrichum tortipilum]|uniref:BTB domain-containing protein n=1 Tax=Staphylotrichum tortipilum TaxID=2831512 RepID=A0AAN6MTD8_9PEZI|nr:hypothetical protein C8A05DRAFT_12187 [Staphylotrichum longicolle]